MATRVWIDQSEVDRFFAKVNRSGEHWLWTAGCYGRDGEYGRFYPKGSRKPIPAHRWSYQYHNDLIVPSDLVVDHECRVTLCVRPDHLRVVTHQENILAGIGLAAMQAKQIECKRGHSLADAHILKDGARDCRVCRRIRNSGRVRGYRKVHG